MQEQSAKPPMDDYDKALVAYLDRLVELDDAGKLESFTHEQIFGESKKIIEKAQAKERAERIKAYKSQMEYAI